MSLPGLTSEKITQLQKHNTLSLTYSAAHMKIYSTDAMGILHKKVIDFNSMFSSVVIPKILIKYLLHTFHDSLGHVGATKLYNFIKRFYYFPGT